MKVVKRYHQLQVIIEGYTPGTRTVGGSKTNASMSDVHMVRKGTEGDTRFIIKCVTPQSTWLLHKNLFASCF